MGNSDLPLVTVPFRTNQQIRRGDNTQSINKFLGETTNSQQQHVTIVKITEHLRTALSRTANDITYGISNCASHERLMIQNHGNE